MNLFNWITWNRRDYNERDEFKWKWKYHIEMTMEPCTVNSQKAANANTSNTDNELFIHFSSSAQLTWWIYADDVKTIVHGVWCMHKSIAVNWKF